MIQNNLTLLN